ncbi:hypothetical protein MNEG_1587 [Monoraphidium neglectum]|uniref:Pentatricopeptide repeat-containing protein n=1 Tax=Monoraphidium neglectum TaxID=145388 RepID=A0A0D2IT53_9CHLO|nr:hypothetical protein MNEG_1587 [Monoraphidium neglectum]KIY91222.1 hypothetical protein MNEG_1587 [Monoraphidium neglectum]|eukprot:XP_013890242.1 hypothetical protein MNEG_1587 [Monoraphidium neglectum]
MFDAPPAPAAACAGARGAGCAANNTAHPLTCTQGAGGDAGAGFDSGETNASDLSNSASGANNAAAHRSSGANAQPRGGNTGGGSGGHRHARPSGYRRLWAAVCGPDGAPGGDRGGGGAFGHRGGSDPGAAAASWRDVSVEELIRGVQALPASAPAGDAVRAGLAYLDSRAFAALLKGLSKAGLGNRAMELFDDVRRVPLDNNPCTGSRSLENSNELSHLADVYTYTTAISQCSSHHQLRRALELVSEMRARKVALNVHTYSALLNVCLKCNELDLALDIYQQARLTFDHVSFCEKGVLGGSCKAPTGVGAGEGSGET